MKFIQDTKYNIQKTVFRIQNTIYKIRYTKSSIAFLTLGVIIAAIAISTFLLKSDGAAAWYSDNWSYRKILTVDADQVSGTGALQDFPMLVSLTSDANLSANAQADGDDIFFTDKTGNKLAHEIESYSSGTLVAWVRVPTLYGAQDTEIFMYYGNASVASQENATGVWGSDYAGVWHLGEDTTDEATSATHADSTSNGNDGTQSGNVDTTGKIGTAQDFDGSNDYINIGEVSQVSSYPMTISGWIKGENGSNAWAGNDAFFEIDLGSWRQTRLYSVGSAPIITALQTDDTSVTSGGHSGYTDNTWYYYTIVIPSINDTITWYINGVSSRTLNPDSGKSWHFFNYLTLGSNPNSFPGLIDEARISSTARSADWIATEYANQDDPSAFLTVGYQQERTRGPAAYWTFNEGTGTTVSDSSGNSNTGTLGTGSSAPTWRTEESCISGKCLQFDGSNDYVEMGNDTINSLEDLTFVAWFKTPDITRTEGLVTIVNTGNINLEFLTVGLISSKVVASADNDPQSSKESSTLQSNTWYHVAVIKNSDATVDYIYINGIDDTNPATTYWGTDEVTTEIGRANGTTDWHFKGFIDEVKIYPYARTADEIKMDYQMGSVRGAAVSIGGGDESFLSDGLVGYWDMEGIGSTGNGVSIPDKSGNGNTGTTDDGANNTGMNCTTAGKYGGGCDFDGSDDYVDATYFSNLQATGTFTASVWFKVDSTATNTYNIIANSAGGSFTRFAIQINNSELRAGFNNGSTNPNRTTSFTDTTSFHHVVVTNTNGTDMRLFLDGVEITTSSTTASTGAGTDFRIGSSISGTNVFDGKIDEVRIYNRALSADEVKKLYAWAPGPVVYYNFDEGSGTTSVQDRSSYGNTGTMEGSISEDAWVTGKFGTALTFDGSDDTVSGTTNGIIPQAGTVSLWIKPAWSGNDDTVRTIYGWEVTDWDTNAMYLQKGDDNTLRFWVSDSSATSYRTIYTDISSWAAGDWHHVGGSWDSSLNLSLYIDGIKQSVTLYDEGTPTLPSQVASEFNIVGNDQSHVIDELRVYNYARTQAQILEDMNAGHPAVGTPVGSTVLHLSMDEGYGTTVHDKSPQGNNGTLGTGSSAPSWSNDGKWGKALSFDGTNDYVDTGKTISSLTEGDGTVSWWFKPTTVYNDSAVRAMWGATTNTTIPEFSAQKHSNNNIYVGWNSSSNDDRVVLAATSTNFPQNQWIQYVFTWVEDGYSNLYINGKLAGTNNGATTITTPTTNLRIGQQGNIAQRFAGLIDEVKIYPFALTAEQVAIEYNGGKMLVLGSQNTGVGGTTPSNSASRDYCVPGDTTSCAGPVLEINMEEKAGTTAYDTSTNGNNGTLTGGPSWRSPGDCKVGNCLEFDGSDDYVSVSDSSTLDITSEVTMSLWIKPGNTFSTFPRLIEKGQNSAYEIYMNNLTPTLRIGASSSLTADNALMANVWTYLAATYSSITDEAKIYYNGKLEKSGTITSTSIGTNNDPLRIGRQEAAFYWRGAMDQISIYNYVRTPAQIAWDMNKGAPIAHYKFDECQGETAYDASGNGNDGDITIGSNGENTVGDCGTSSTAWGSGASGKWNSSLSFDGSDDHMETTSTTIIDTSAAYSVAFWAKPTSDGQSSLGTFFDEGNIAAYMTTNDAIAICSAAGGCSSNNAQSTNNVVANNTWSHITYVHTGSGTYAIYVNGKNVTSDATAGTTNDNVALRIGSDGAGSFNYHGQIDDFRVYRYPLTAHQVREIYGNGAVTFK